MFKRIHSPVCTSVADSFLAGKPGFSKKQADLFFPPDFQDDFPVAMQVLLQVSKVLIPC
jgi:hypothetical protein